jgi:hypothetical protein
MKLLSEHYSLNKTAKVYYRSNFNDYVAVTYDSNGFAIASHPFDSEEAAENHAKDSIS